MDVWAAPMASIAIVVAREELAKTIRMGGGNR